MKKLMVLVAALALVAGSALTAAAADWNFYGSARVSTFFTDLDDADTTNYEQGLQGNARIGASVKVSDELTGGFEYGTGVNVRKLYGEWNFGAGSLLVGQTYTPLNYFYSNQVFGTDNDMLAQGGVYSGREAMIRLKFGAFEIAVMEPNTDMGAGNAAYDVEDFIGDHPGFFPPGFDLEEEIPGHGGLTLADTTLPGFELLEATSYKTETTFPAIEANYNLVMDMFSMNLGAGYQTYEILTPAGGVDVDSYIVTLGAKTTFGPAYLGGNVYMGQNVGNIISVSLDGDNEWDDGLANFDVENNKVIDNDGKGFIVVGGFKANDMFSFEAGYGYAEAEEWDADTGSSDNEVQTYYVQSTITLAPGVFITPEIGVIDGDEAGSEETTYYGAKWQINF
jgi:hypothetical protein